jgi:hypothetical protein
MYEAAASCKEIARAPVTNWEPPGVTLAGHCYAMKHGMKVQIATLYRVSHLQRYGVTVRSNDTSVYPPLRLIHIYHAVPLPCRAAKGLDRVFPI